MLRLTQFTIEKKTFLDLRTAFSAALVIIKLSKRNVVLYVYENYSVILREEQGLWVDTE